MYMAEINQLWRSGCTRVIRCITNEARRRFRPSAGRSGSNMTRRNFSTKELPRTKHTDILIIGGGVMGSSAAYFLKSKSPSTNVTVLERDPKYLKAATTLSVSSIRQQFSIEENILLSMWSYGFLSHCSKHLQIPGQDPPDAQLKKGGYFFMASEAGRNVLTENFELQRSLGAEVHLLDSSGLKGKYPWLNTDGVCLGCVGTANEGWFDPWSLLLGFRKKAISIGVEYIDAEALQVKLDDNGMIAGADVRDPGDASQTFFISCDKLINAAGPWSGYLMQSIGVDLPVRPRKRYVFSFDCPKGPKDMLLAVDISGCWFRKEGSGSLYICGKSPSEENDPDSDDLHVDYDYFQNEIWPCIAERVPAFEELKVRHSWAGFYEYNTFDQNGIVGAHTDIKNLYFVTGFSGHGIQQSPAVGNAISELITTGEYSTIDLTRFSYDRIQKDVPLKEKNIV